MAEDTKNNGLTNEEEDNEIVEEQDNDNGSSGNSGNDESDKDSKGSKGNANTGKTFTQDQVTRMMTREKNQGRNAVYKELGIDPKDSKAIASLKALIDSQKTDEQKAAEKESENQAKMNEAEQRAQVAEAKAEAMMLGVKTQYVDDVVTLALAKMTEDSDIKTIIGEFKTKYPVWFGESSEDDKNDKKGKTGQRGTGSSVKTSKEDKGGKEERGLGLRLAAQRKSSSKKSSYWGNK